MDFKEMQEISTLSIHIPNEILFIIFTFCEGKTLSNCILCSKKYKELIDTEYFWENVSTEMGKGMKDFKNYYSDFQRSWKKVWGFLFLLREKTKVCFKSNAKIVLCGRTKSGKSSIAKRFCFGGFDDEYTENFCASYFSKQLKVVNPLICQNIKLEIWDTCGIEKFKSVANMYYRDAQFVIITFDITNVKSFSDARIWLREVKRMGSPDSINYLVGTKNDLEYLRAVDPSEVQEYADEQGVNYLECSSKNGYNIDLIFQLISKENNDSELYEEIFSELYESFQCNAGFPNNDLQLKSSKKTKCNCGCLIS